MKKYTLVSLLLLCSFLSNAQDFGTRSRQFFAINVLTGGVIGGIGSVCHPKESQTRGNAFLHGFWKGCIGGSLTFAGKYMVYGITKNNDLAYAWPAKLVHAAGASIMENAARNAAIYDNFALDYGALRVDVNQKGRMMVRPMPAAIAGIILSSSKGSVFNIINTVKMGTPVFVNNNTNKFISNNGIESGQTIINSVTISPVGIIASNFVFNTQNSIYNISAHELVHVFQERESLSINNIYFKNTYKWVYLDAPVSEVLYGIASVNNKQYYSNIYELEAQSFATHTAVK